MYIVRMELKGYIGQVDFFGYLPPVFHLDKHTYDYFISHGVTLMFNLTYNQINYCVADEDLTDETVLTMRVCFKNKSEYVKFMLISG